VKAAPPSFRFVNKLAPAGISPVRAVVLKQGKVLKVAAKAVDLLLATAQGAVGVRITTGSIRNCALFDAATIRRDETNVFIAEGAVAASLADCSNASLGGSTTTSSSTTSTSSSSTVPAVCGNGILEPGEQCEGSCADLECVQCTCCSSQSCIDGVGCCPGLNCAMQPGPGGTGFCTAATCGGVGFYCTPPQGFPCCPGLLCRPPNGGSPLPVDFCCLGPGGSPCTSNGDCCTGTCDAGVCSGGSPTGTRCCEFSQFSACLDFLDPVAEDCEIYAGATLTAPGLVCDGATGTCQPARTGVGSCCELPSGVGCFEGSGSGFDVLCAFSDGTPLAGQVCLPAADPTTADCATP
jgi:hypothetical protein